MPGLVEALAMIKKVIDKSINLIPGLYRIQKNALYGIAHLLMGSIINVTEKYHPKEVAKNLNIYNHYLPSCLVLEEDPVKGY